ncbi:hypothetical protein ACIBO6_28990 [Streptomyces luteogriseus]|uniref:hypothetical protein n=1 Tax=Streptomyces luteogriseus TaxID=68233 RepID=UPI0037A9FF85
MDAPALNLWPAHDAVAAVLYAGLAHVAAAMVADPGDRTLRHSGLETVKGRLLESGGRLLTRGVPCEDAAR